MRHRSASRARPAVRRAAAALFGLAVLVTACGGEPVGPSATADPIAGSVPPATAAPASGAAPGSAAPSRSPASSPSSQPVPGDPDGSPLPPSDGQASPSPTPTPTPTLRPSPPLPSVELYWARAAGAAIAGGRFEVVVTGASPGTLRYEPTASATAIDDEVVFICSDGQAFDGQSGFSKVPGAWSCGIDAFVSGFRSAGQPVDAWSRSLPADVGVAETIDYDAIGRWRWSYRAHSPVWGGQVRTEVAVDPFSGRIASARRIDPTGVTEYFVTYDADFPEIAVPRP